MLVTRVRLPACAYFSILQTSNRGGTIAAGESHHHLASSPEGARSALIDLGRQWSTCKAEPSLLQEKKRVAHGVSPRGQSDGSQWAAAGALVVHR